MLIGETLTNIPALPNPVGWPTLLIIRGSQVTDVTSRQTLRFGRFGLLGNLEKLLEANAPIQTKLKTELAVPR